MVRPFGLLWGVCFVLSGTLGCQRDPVLDGKHISEWATQLRSAEPSARLAAVRAIGKAEADMGVPALIQALRDEDVGVRKEAVSALSKVGAPATLALLDALSDVEIRGEAIKALGAIGPPAKAAVAPLLSILRGSANPSTTSPYLGSASLME